MRKILLTLSIALVKVCMGQDFETGFSKPVASVSSLSTYTNSPVSYATGVPDISFPLVSLPTNSEDIIAGMNISYHPKNLLSGEKASEVGLGWSLLGINGVISREVVKELDEKYDDASSGNYIKNEFNDIYYYNIGGYSGKFRIIRDLTNNTFQLIKLTPSNLKIEYVRNSNTATLIFNSFKITDDKGYIYVFDKNSISEYKNGSQINDYKSAFFLTKIYDYKMQELVSMDYQVDVYYPMADPLTPYQNCKLKKIWSKDNGSIELDYTYTESLKNSMNDPYQVNSIILKNNAGNIISKLEFIYNTSSFTNPYDYKESIWKRALWKIKKYSSDLAKSEMTEFEYNNSGSSKEYGPVSGQFKDYFLCDYASNNPGTNEIENPKYFSLGSLKKVKLPTGGVVEYNFEANEYAHENFTQYMADFNDNMVYFGNPQFQYLKPIYTTDFDTNLSTTYNFTVTSTPMTNKAVYVKYIVNEIYPYPPLIDPGDGSQPSLTYTILDANYNDGHTNVLCSTPPPIVSSTKFMLAPGAHTIKIQSPTGGKGHIEVYEMAIKDAPYKNAIVERDLGVRIESIKYFENFSSQTPAKFEKFAYDKFDDTNSSSGESIEEGMNMGYPIQSIIYKNVKVLNGDTGGYTKYYYKAPSAYPVQPSFPYRYWPNINITKGGLIDKKEVYNTGNQLLASENYDYTIAEMNIPNYVPLADGDYETKTAWIKEQRITSKVFGQNARALTSSSETVRSADDFNLITEKTTNSDGSIDETIYKYAKDKNHTALINVNILGIPLETQIKKNGTVIAKSETRYDNTLLLYPTAVLGYTPDNLVDSYMGIRYDAYDEKGHIVQYSTTPDSPTGYGTPSTIIWGYNKTLPIAKIDGATISDIPQHLIDAIVTASNEDANATPATAQTKEDALLAQLESFKNNSVLSNFSVTAFTYNPLIGLTNVLPPSGIREIYLYDSFGRLEKVKDVNGKVLKEYQYNYKQ
ncbi:hypothetical protein [Chryseobacterium defluvii]|uniref:YD repeat-containing protein n=1 Tax=Chryseobacterium defluvii TaxID=160396 RepID=A0A495SDB2_9FLAO|nr:hypothetical protein [Chryseobacterium defluvii]RKS97856.1 hypothetical protein BCF58_1990 [Chryseobacterium defluvii]